MIPTVSYTSGSDYIQFNWNYPKYRPEIYEVKYACMMKRAHKNDDFIKTKTQYMNLRCNSFRISGLRPDSTCVLNLVTVYNPASIDPGIVITASTCTCTLAKIPISEFLVWVLCNVHTFCTLITENCLDAKSELEFVLFNWFLLTTVSYLHNTTKMISNVANSFSYIF